MDRNFKTQLEELQKIARAADKIDRERAEQFESLVTHPGWKTYQELLTIRIQMFADALLAPAGSIDGAIALEFVKGTMSGLIIAKDLPSVTIQGIKAAVPATDGEDE